MRETLLSDIDRYVVYVRSYAYRYGTIRPMNLKISIVSRTLQFQVYVVPSDLQTRMVNGA